MGRRKTLSDTAIKLLPTKEKAYAHPDPEMPGLYVRVRPTGAKMFCDVGRAPSRQQVWHTICATTLYGFADARESAREAIIAIRDGKSRNGPDTVGTVANEWFKEKAEG